MSTRVTLYGKAGCHLCEEAQDALDEVAADTPFELEVIDVARDPRLFRLYGERIPVLAVDGEDILELGFGSREIREALGIVNP